LVDAFAEAPALPVRPLPRRVDEAGEHVGLLYDLDECTTLELPRWDETTAQRDVPTSWAPRRFAVRQLRRATVARLSRSEDFERCS
jgi:hypothetical protein